MKFMTWTLHKPNNSDFGKFAKLKNGEPWYSDKYEIIDPEAPKSWGYNSRSFLEMIQIHNKKFYSIGLHEFGVRADGRITDMTYGLNLDDFVLDSSKTDIQNPIASSLRYLMHTYKEIKWCLQYLCTEERVESVLLNVNGSQDTFIDECYKITKIYLDKGFPVKGVEIDFEYTWYGSGETEANAYRDLLSRIKNEVCIPLGMELRINMFAMTGKFEPSWYAWHDYETLASARDKNGNQAVDEFQMMSYDFSWAGSAPGTSTPLWWLEQILDHVGNTLPPEKTFIGNAGYGRRWPLGETYADGTIRWGGTLDYKQLMMLQNGTYIHNSGEDSPDGNFYFNDQDFIPFCGFNDFASDYIITYPHVYDKFKMSKEGGAEFKNMNVGDNDEEYVTKYSTEQTPEFGGVELIINDCTEIIGEVNSVGTFQPPDDVKGISNEETFVGYSITSLGGVDEEQAETEVEETIPFNEIVYNFNATGNYKLIAVLNFPFYDKDTLTMNLNGEEIVASIENEHYPMVQKVHFYDLGNQSFSGDNEIRIGLTNGSQIYGFILCSSFNHNFSGGSIIIQPDIVPFKKRGNTDENGRSEIINAQFPSKLKVVGEIIRRPPRPAIIWEDYFGSYDNTNEDSIGKYYDDITGNLAYYPDYSEEGMSSGIWNVYNEPVDNDYPFAYANTENYAQLMLDKKFSSNIVCDLEFMGEGNSSAYGVRIATSSGVANSGHLVLLNFREKQIQIVRENNGTKTVLYYIPMSEAFQELHGSRIKMNVLLLNNKLTLTIDDILYIQEYSLSISAKSMGAYISNGGLRLYKYNLSSLDRWERMERLKVQIDGEIFEYGSVPRNCSIDEYGYLVYTGYPYAIKDSFPNQNITLTQIDKDYSWENDYVNLRLCTYNSWQGKKDVEIISSDAGIWIKTIYIGDNEGMSVCYNSDRIGFIKTVNMINDYGCKGIAMWTLGQEDPSIYSYLP